MDIRKPYWTIFTATLQEVAPLLSYFDSVSYNSTQKAYHIKEEGSIFITGIGPYAAHRSATRAIAHTKNRYQCRWLNIGICGALHTVDIGKVVIPRVASLLSWHPVSLFTEESQILFPNGNKEERLFTSPMPIYDPYSIENYTRGYVDMEAYPIADIAYKQDIPCSVIKIVSDMCSQSSLNVIQAQLPLLQPKIAHLGYSWVIGHD